MHQDPAPAVKVVARKMGLITKETPEDIAKKEGVMVDELSPEKLEQAKAIVLDGSQMALMMEEGLSHIMRTHDEVVISGYACPPPCPLQSRLTRRFLLSFFLSFVALPRTDASQKLKIVRAAQMMRKSEVRAGGTSQQLATLAKTLTPSVLNRWWSPPARSWPTAPAWPLPTSASPHRYRPHFPEESGP